jgi:hypothetical protein
LEPLKKYLANKKFTADGDVKQAVSFWLQKLENDLLYAGLQAWYHGGTDGLKVNGELVVRLVPFATNVPFTTSKLLP